MTKARTPVRTDDPIRAKSVPVTKGKVDGFLSFGKTNQFPQQLIAACNDSVTAAACLKIRARFIEGNGFLKTALSKLVVNRQRQTLDHILSRTAQNVSSGEIVCLHIGYNGLGKVVSVRPVPFESVRLGQPDDLGNISYAGVFPYLNSSLKSKSDWDKHTKLPFFDPRPETVQAQIAAAGGIDQYEGQLFYDSLWSPGDNYYHTPSYFSVNSQIETEPLLANYHYRITSNGFSGSGFVCLVIDGDEDPDDPDSVENQMSRAMGSRDAGMAVVLKFKTKEALEAFKFENTTGAQLSDKFGATSEVVKMEITTGMGVPSELANVRRAGGALFQSALEQKMAFQMMQATVNPFQRKIKEAFEQIFAHWHQPLPATDFSIEPVKFFPDDMAVTTTAATTTTGE